MSKQGPGSVYDVELADHDPAWRGMYTSEAQAIEEILGEKVLMIDHVGSTSIPGIKAKPVIDILVQCVTADVDYELKSAFRARGYEMKTFAERKEVLFYKEIGGKRVYNVHIAQYGSDLSTNMLKFRDTLRADPVLAKEYEALKIQSAAQTKDSQEYYRAKKHFFSHAIGWGY